MKNAKSYPKDDICMDTFSNKFIAEIKTLKKKNESYF